MNHIKLPINFFDSDKVKAIRSQKDGDSVVLFYTMLITTAVKSNADGFLMLCEDIPYDDKILSGILNLPLAIVKNGLELLVKFGLLTFENNIFSLVNYDEFADIKTVKERKQNANRQARFKAKQTDRTITTTPKKAVKSTDVSE